MEKAAMKDLKQPSRASKIRSPYLIGLLVIGTVLLIMVIFLILLHQKSSNLTKQSTPYKLSQQTFGASYSKLEAYKLSGNGQGMSFSKPVEFKTLPLSDTEVWFKQIEVKGPAHVNKGGMAARSRLGSLGETFSDSFSKKPGDKQYDTALGDLTQFFQAVVGPLYAVKFQPAQPFTNDSIKQNAWVFDMTALPKNSNPNANFSIENYKGRAVVAVGQSNFYYLVVYSLNFNWQPNQAVWQKVTDSLKIDQ